MYTRGSSATGICASASTPKTKPVRRNRHAAELLSTFTRKSCAELLMRDEYVRRRLRVSHELALRLQSRRVLHPSAFLTFQACNSTARPGTPPREMPRPTP